MTVAQTMANPAMANQEPQHRATTPPLPGYDGYASENRTTKAAPRPRRCRRMQLSRLVSRFLLVLGGFNVLTGLFSLHLIRNRAVCDGMLCTICTMGSHPGTTFTLAAGYLFALATLILFTRGLTEVNTIQAGGVVMLIVIGTLCAGGVMTVVMAGAALFAILLAPAAMLLLNAVRFRPFTPDR